MAGVVLVLLLAALMTQPSLRLPALVVGLLSIPGNVDNYVPQMRMDLHPLPGNTGPAISVVDALIVLALVLTLREGRHRALDRWQVRLLISAVGLAIIASTAALFSSLLLGVEPLATVRGILTFARIPAVLFLAFALFPIDQTIRRFAVASLIGGIALIGNGIYTSATNDYDRFTAATFGRNGLGLALALVAILAAGLAISLIRERRIPGGVAAGIVGAASLWGALATGTRMSLLAFLVGLGVAMVALRAWRSRRTISESVGVLAAAAIVGAAAMFLTVGGGRSISVITDLDTTVEEVTDPEAAPATSEVERRYDFWSQALQMTFEHPFTGVGPYQFNILRYDLDPDAPLAVANPHNTYVQIAAEFGLVALGAYLIVLAFLAWPVVRAILITGIRAPPVWLAGTLLGSAIAYPFTELTNSHLFNVRLGAYGWIAIGLAVAVAMRAVRSPQPTDPS